MAARPTAPSPHTAQLVPGSTPAVFIAAPYPVGIPHPRRQTLSREAFSFTLQREMSATTVY